MKHPNKKIASKIYWNYRFSRAVKISRKRIIEHFTKLALNYGA